jgi:hypothetical protein
VGYVVDLWERALRPWIDSLWDSLTVWRWWGLVAAALIAGLIQFRTPLARWVLGLSTRDHDVAIFKAADAIADERFLDGLLNRDVYQGRCELDDAMRLDHFTQHLARTENQYRDRALRRATTKLLAALAPVQRGVRTHFFAIEKGDVLKFYPDHIDEQRYRRSAKEMNAALNMAWPAFQRYRRVVKTRLTT